MSPFAFFCGLPAAVHFAFLANALFICVALLLMEESLFDGPANLVGTALSKIRFAPEVRPVTPGNVGLSWVLFPLDENGMIDESAEMAETWPGLGWYGPLAAARSKVASVN